MEIKRVTENFGDRSNIPWTPDEIAFIINKIEMLFDECDTELMNAEMPPLGYEKQPTSTMIEHMVILLNYVYDAHPQCCIELDHPLYVGFKNGATQALSEIVLEDITTDNTFEMQRYVEVYDSTGHYYTSELKNVLTMKDFLGLDAVVPEEGMFVIENVETIGWFTALFRTDYESMGAAVESLDQMLEMYLHSGEFSHKEYHPIGNFVSGLLDVTIIKPFIESIYGKDLITGEKLTDFERGMQLVNAVVGVVTFGQGALALNFAEMSGKEIATALLKTWAVEAVSDMSAYTVGYAFDELGMPTSVTFLASLATGCSVSVKAGKYVFQDASNNIVKQLDADEMQTFLKELDVDLGDVTWGGGYKGGSPSVKNKNITGMDWYEYFRETYGKENVCWENCNPTEVATAWQGSYPYVGVDTYKNTILHDGEIIWMGEPFPTGYSTTTEAIADLGNDAQKVFSGLQVKPYYENGMPYAEYRSSLMPYKVHGKLNVAEGLAVNNPQFGVGGLTQRFDPNFDYNYANGFLERLDGQAIELTNTKVSLEDYFNMMDGIK